MPVGITTDYPLCSALLWMAILQTTFCCALLCLAILQPTIQSTDTTNDYLLCSTMTRDTTPTFCDALLYLAMQQAIICSTLPVDMLVSGLVYG
jgi:hypothetical protein